MTASRHTIEIERIVLTGAAAARLDARTLADAVRAEATRVLAETGQMRSAALDSIRVRDAALRPGNASAAPLSSAALARVVAHAVGRAIRRTGECSDA